ncbi:50S ribosomal protein L10, partial [Staphylococcus epidermidis]|nr:50S ribosomal protein L10 [Staphylococcus epidermidis]
MEVSECLLSLKQKTTSRYYIAEQLKNSVSTVIVDYRGLTVAEVTELRSQLREAGVEYKVYKNTMVRRAAEQAGIEGLDE